MKNIQLPSPVLLMLVPVIMVMLLVCVKLTAVDIQPSFAFFGKQLAQHWSVSVSLK